MRTGRVIGLLVLLFCISTWITISEAQENLSRCEGLVARAGC